MFPIFLMTTLDLEALGLKVLDPEALGGLRC